MTPTGLYFIKHSSPPNIFNDYSLVLRCSINTYSFTKSIKKNVKIFAMISEVDFNHNMIIIKNNSVKRVEMQVFVTKTSKIK